MEIFQKQFDKIAEPLVKEFEALANLASNSNGDLFTGGSSQQESIIKEYGLQEEIKELMSFLGTVMKDPKKYQENP